MKLLIILLSFLPVALSLYKKHDYKIPIIILWAVSVAIFILTVMLYQNREIEQNAQIMLGIVAGIMWIGALIWCFITPKNKE